MAHDKLGIHHHYAGLFRHPAGQPAACDKKISRTPADMAGVSSCACRPGSSGSFSASRSARTRSRSPTRRLTRLATDGRDRRSGQSAGRQQDHEVRRGDEAVRADEPRHRLRCDVRAAARTGIALSGRPAGKILGGCRRRRSTITRRSSTHEEKKVAEELQEGGASRSTRPITEAFRTFAQKKYLNSPYAKDWPKGMLERINAIR